MGWPDVAAMVLEGWPLILYVGLVLLVMGGFYLAILRVGGFVSKLLKGEWKIRGKDKSATYTGPDRRK